VNVTAPEPCEVFPRPPAHVFFAKTTLAPSVRSLVISFVCLELVGYAAKSCLSPFHDHERSLVQLQLRNASTAELKYRICSETRRHAWRNLNLDNNGRKNEFEINLISN